MSDLFDLDFQPTTYWGPQSLSSYFGSHITGEHRRLSAQCSAYNSSEPELSVDPVLSNEERILWGRIHPHNMGGEYLPPLRSNEVEIARVILETTTLDVISIRARKSGNRIYYRVVDEYMDQEGSDRFVAKPRWSKQPLTLRQVISIIDDNGLIDEWREENFDVTDLDESLNLARADSVFYPKICGYYFLENENWRREKQILMGDEFRFAITAKDNAWRRQVVEKLKNLDVEECEKTAINNVTSAFSKPSKLDWRTQQALLKLARNLEKAEAGRLGMEGKMFISSMAKSFRQEVDLLRKLFKQA